MTENKKDINIAAIQLKNWLVPEEAAAYAGISRRQIDKLRIEGNEVTGETLPYSKVGKSILIRRTKLDSFIERHEVKSAT